MGGLILRIKRIFVKKLFNLFDHDIPLKINDRITIIHAPNGFGKTAILRLIDSVFNSRYYEVRTFPFDTFGVEFDDSEVLLITKPNGRERSKKNSRDYIPQTLEFQYKGQNYVRSPVNEKELPFPIEAVQHFVPDLQQIGPFQWRTPEGEMVTIHEIYERYPEMAQFTKAEITKEPKWLHGLRTQFDVRFIRTDRLVGASERPHRLHKEGRSQLAPAVTSYSDELSALIKSTLARYAELSQSLDRTFPNRLVYQSASPNLSKDAISEKLAEFEEKRARLTAAGLLDKEQELPFPVPQSIDETKLSVLTVYVDDIEQKLGVFDSLAAKIDLFKSVINQRFRHKAMAISKEQGIVFTTDSGQLLQATSLSSGEQHEVVLMYELLFKVRPDSLILIDEPEISLHVAWQEQFLRDLTEMTKLSRFDVLIATHSPQIISDRWDLTVELKDRNA